MPERVFRLDLASGETSKTRRTPQGGLIAQANLTRTGVFNYRMPDGSNRRELRHPDDVFHPDSLATYPLAPVTVDHPGRVGPSNWRTHAVGTIGPTVAPHGDFVTGEVHVQHGDAIDRAESGDLRELSCGYSCDIDPTPGTYKSQPYDVAQKNIRMNHVAMGPRGWGRMGPETRMKLDAAEAISGESSSDEGSDSARYVRDNADDQSQEGESMTPEEKAALERAEKAARDASDALTKARQDTKDAQTAGEKLAAQAREDAAEITKLRAENAMLTLHAERSRQDGKTAEEQARADAEVDRRAEEKVQLRADAKVVFATAEDPEAKRWKSDGKNSDQIRREIIRFLEPKMPLVFDSSGNPATTGTELSGPSLLSVYTMAMSHKRDGDKARADALAAAAGPRREDGAEGDEDEEEPDAATARKGMIARMKAGSKKNADRKPGRR